MDGNFNETEKSFIGFGRGGNDAYRSILVLQRLCESASAQQVVSAIDALPRTISSPWPTKTL